MQSYGNPKVFMAISLFAVLVLMTWNYRTNQQIILDITPDYSKFKDDPIIGRVLAAGEDPGPYFGIFKNNDVTTKIYGTTAGYTASYIIILFWVLYAFAIQSCKFAAYYLPPNFTPCYYCYYFTQCFINRLYKLFTFKNLFYPSTGLDFVFLNNSVVNPKGGEVVLDGFCRICWLYGHTTSKHNYSFVNDKALNLAERFNICVNHNFLNYAPDVNSKFEINDVLAFWNNPKLFIPDFKSDLRFTQRTVLPTPFALVTADQVKNLGLDSSFDFCGLDIYINFYRRNPHLFYVNATVDAFNNNYVMLNTILQLKDIVNYVSEENLNVSRVSCVAKFDTNSNFDASTINVLSIKALLARHYKGAILRELIRVLDGEIKVVDVDACYDASYSSSSTPSRVSIDNSRPSSLRRLNNSESSSITTTPRHMPFIDTTVPPPGFRAKQTPYQTPSVLTPVSESMTPSDYSSLNSATNVSNYPAEADVCGVVKNLNDAISVTVVEDIKEDILIVESLLDDIINEAVQRAEASVVKPIPVPPPLPSVAERSFVPLKLKTKYDTLIKTANDSIVEPHSSKILPAVVKQPIDFMPAWRTVKYSFECEQQVLINNYYRQLWATIMDLRARKYKKLSFLKGSDLSTCYVAYNVMLEPIAGDLERFSDYINFLTTVNIGHRNFDAYQQRSFKAFGESLIKIETVTVDKVCSVNISPCFDYLTRFCKFVTGFNFGFILLLLVFFTAMIPVSGHVVYNYRAGESKCPENVVFGQEPVIRALNEHYVNAPHLNIWQLDENYYDTQRNTSLDFVINEPAYLENPTFNLKFLDVENRINKFPLKQKIRSVNYISSEKFIYLLTLFSHTQVQEYQDKPLIFPTTKYFIQTSADCIHSPIADFKNVTVFFYLPNCRHYEYLPANDANLYLSVNFEFSQGIYELKHDINAKSFFVYHELQNVYCDPFYTESAPFQYPSSFYRIGAGFAKFRRALTYNLTDLAYTLNDFIYQETFQYKPSINDTCSKNKAGLCKHIQPTNELYTCYNKNEATFSCPVQDGACIKLLEKFACVNKVNRVVHQTVDKIGEATDTITKVYTTTLENTATILDNIVEPVKILRENVEETVTLTGNFFGVNNYTCRFLKHPDTMFLYERCLENIETNLTVITVEYREGYYYQKYFNTTTSLSNFPTKLMGAIGYMANDTYVYYARKLFYTPNTYTYYYPYSPDPQVRGMMWCKRPDYNLFTYDDKLLSCFGIITGFYFIDSVLNNYTMADFITILTFIVAFYFFSDADRYRHSFTKQYWSLAISVVLHLCSYLENVTIFSSIIMSVTSTSNSYVSAIVYASICASCFNIYIQLFNRNQYSNIVRDFQVISIDIIQIAIHYRYLQHLIKFHYLLFFSLAVILYSVYQRKNRFPWRRYVTHELAEYYWHQYLIENSCIDEATSSIINRLRQRLQRYNIERNAANNDSVNYYQFMIQVHRYLFAEDNNKRGFMPSVYDLDALSPVIKAEGFIIPEASTLLPMRCLDNITFSKLCILRVTYKTKTGRENYMYATALNLGSGPALYILRHLFGNEYKQPDYSRLNITQTNKDIKETLQLDFDAAVYKEQLIIIPFSNQNAIGAKLRVTVEADPLEYCGDVVFYTESIIYTGYARRGQHCVNTNNGWCGNPVFTNLGKLLGFHCAGFKVTNPKHPWDKFVSEYAVNFFSTYDGQVMDLITDYDIKHVSIDIPPVLKPENVIRTLNLAVVRGGFERKQYDERMQTYLGITLQDYNNHKGRFTYDDFNQNCQTWSKYTFNGYNMFACMTHGLPEVVNPESCCTSFTTRLLRGYTNFFTNCFNVACALVTASPYVCGGAIHTPVFLYFSLYSFLKCLFNIGVVLYGSDRSYKSLAMRIVLSIHSLLFMILLAFPIGTLDDNTNLFEGFILARDQNPVNLTYFGECFGKDMEIIEPNYARSLFNSTFACGNQYCFTLSDTACTLFNQTSCYMLERLRIGHSFDYACFIDGPLSTNLSNIFILDFNFFSIVSIICHLCFGFIFIYDFYKLIASFSVVVGAKWSDFVSRTDVLKYTKYITSENAVLALTEHVESKHKQDLLDLEQGLRCITCDKTDNHDLILRISKLRADWDNNPDLDAYAAVMSEVALRYLVVLTILRPLKEEVAQEVVLRLLDSSNMKDHVSLRRLVAIFENAELPASAGIEAETAERIIELITDSDIELNKLEPLIENLRIAVKQLQQDLKVDSDLYASFLSFYDEFTQALTNYRKENLSGLSKKDGVIIDEIHAKLRKVYNVMTHAYNGEIEKQDRTKRAQLQAISQTESQRVANMKKAASIAAGFGKLMKFTEQLERHAQSVSFDVRNNLESIINTVKEIVPKDIEITQTVVSENSEFIIVDNYSVLPVFCGVRLTCKRKGAHNIMHCMPDLRRAFYAHLAECVNCPSYILGMRHVNCDKRYGRAPTGFVDLFKFYYSCKDCLVCPNCPAGLKLSVCESKGSHGVVSEMFVIPTTSYGEDACIKPNNSYTDVIEMFSGSGRNSIVIAARISKNVKNYNNRNLRLIEYLEDPLYEYYVHKSVVVGRDIFNIIKLLRSANTDVKPESAESDITFSTENLDDILSVNAGSCLIFYTKTLTTELIKDLRTIIANQNLPLYVLQPGKLPHDGVCLAYDDYTCEKISLDTLLNTRTRSPNYSA